MNVLNNNNYYQIKWSSIVLIWLQIFPSMHVLSILLSLCMAGGTATAGTAMAVPPFRVVFLFYFVCVCNLNNNNDL